MGVTSRRAAALTLVGVACVALGCGDGGRDRADARQPTMAIPPLSYAADPLANVAIAADSFCVDVVPSPHCHPFRIGGVAYTIAAEGHPENFSEQREHPPEGLRQVRIYDDSARLVYREAFRTLFADGTVDEPRNWVDVEVRGLEDAAGVGQGFLITYSAYVRRETVPDVYQRIIAPRGGKLEALVPKFTHYGDLGRFREGSRRGSIRLLDGDRFVVQEWRHYFAASVPYRVDFRCAPGAETCVTLALPDSIAGLARFDVDAERLIAFNYEYTAHLDLDTATVELFATPGAERGERLRVGSRGVKVLGGAGRVRFGGAGIDGTAGDVTKDDWLHIRLVSGRTGWIRGHHDFTAIGLLRTVLPPPGSAIPEPPPRTEMNDL